MPAVRSWIMMSIVLLAVILDRPALTMRNVAFAALLILVISPESLFDPSFEMSFAAVVGLVALVEANGKRERDRAQDVSFVWRTLRKIWAIIAGDVVTTLVATTAVAPFAIYYFHRLSHYGVVANLIALPLVSLLIMPIALLSLVAMPFGLEAWPLLVMGFGIDLLVATGKWVASWPWRRLHRAFDLRHFALPDGAWRPVALSLADALAGARAGHCRGGPARERRTGRGPTC